MVLLGHKKSRHGCIRCKRRRVKCDEQKPCGHCIRRGEHCSLMLQAGTTPTARELRAKANSLLTPSPSIDGSPYEFESSSAFAAGVRQSSMLIPSSESWSQDLFLMHHYTMHTALTFTRMPEVQELWQTYVPELAGSNVPLMHGVLSVAALHLGYLYPEQGAKYLQLSSGHYGMALSSFRAILPAITRENCNALFALASLISISNMAEFSRRANPASISDIIELFVLVNGVRNVLDPAIRWIFGGPFGTMLYNQGFNPRPDLTKPTPLPPAVRAQLDALRDMAQETCTPDVFEGFRAWSPLSRNRSVIDVLETVYGTVVHALSDSGNEPEMALVYRWAGLLSPDYLSLLREHNPAALAVLAHFFVLTSICDHKWYHHGCAPIAMAAIREALPEDWMPWLAWPEEQLANGFQALREPVEQAEGQQLDPNLDQQLEQQRGDAQQQSVSPIFAV